MALVELGRDTGERRYVDAGRLVHRPARPGPPAGSPAGSTTSTTRRSASGAITGHAVRALYLYSGATDVYLETGDETLSGALAVAQPAAAARLRHRRRRGALGPRVVRRGLRAAQRGGLRRDLRRRGARPVGLADAARQRREPLPRRASRRRCTTPSCRACRSPATPTTTRTPCRPRSPPPHRLVPCACCPPNLARTLASLPRCLRHRPDGGVWIHQYAASRVRRAGRGPRRADRQETGYPWAGSVMVEEARRRLGVRSRSRLRRGRDAAGRRRPAGRRAGRVRRGAAPLAARRHASSLPLEPPRLRPTGGWPPTSAAARSCAGRWCTASRRPTRAARTPGTCADVARLGGGGAPRLLGGCVTLQADGQVLRDEDDPDELYRRADRVHERLEPARLAAIPYHLWANREPGSMQVCDARGRR